MVALLVADVLAELEALALGELLELVLELGEVLGVAVTDGVALAAGMRPNAVEMPRPLIAAMASG